MSSVEPDGIVLITKSGISKVYFVELPKEMQERFHYDAAKAAQFTTVQQSAIAESNAVVAAQQQQEAQERQRQAAAIAQQRQQAEEQQRQADAIAVRQQQRQLEAQQKQAAKIAAQKQARNQHQRRRRGDARRAIEEDVRGQNEAQREEIRYQIDAFKMELVLSRLAKSKSRH